MRSAQMRRGNVTVEAGELDSGTPGHTRVEVPGNPAPATVLIVLVLFSTTFKWKQLSESLSFRAPRSGELVFDLCQKNHRLTLQNNRDAFFFAIDNANNIKIFALKCTDQVSLRTYTSILQIRNRYYYTSELLPRLIDSQPAPSVPPEDVVARSLRWFRISRSAEPSYIQLMIPSIPCTNRTRTD